MFIIGLFAAISGIMAGGVATVLERLTGVSYWVWVIVPAGVAVVYGMVRGLLIIWWKKKYGGFMD